MLKRCLIIIQIVARLVSVRLFKYIILYVSIFVFHSLVGKLDGVNFLILIENDTDYLTPRGIKLHMFGSYVMEFRYHCRTRVLFV